MLSSAALSDWLATQVLRQIGALQQATSDLRKLDGFVRSSKPPAAEVTELQVRL